MDDFTVVRGQPKTIKQESTLELAKEFADRLRAQNGVHEIPKETIHTIMNYLEAEALERTVPMLEREY